MIPGDMFHCKDPLVLGKLTTSLNIVIILVLRSN